MQNEAYVPSGPFISLKDAAGWTGWSVARFQGLIADRRLTTLKVGRQMRVLEREIGELCGCKVPGPREQALAELRAEETTTPKVKPRLAHHWIYFLYTVDHDLLYVGITNNGVGRLIQHGNEKQWWPQVDHVKIEHVQTREEALHREAEVIHELEPPFNLAIPRRPESLAEARYPKPRSVAE